MSFDIFFQPCRPAAAAAVEKNPVTGAAVAAPQEPLSGAEIDAVRAVFRKAKAAGPDEFGCCVVDAEDGGSAEIFCRDLANGCMVALGGITPAIEQLLFDMLGAANWMMLPAMEDSLAIAAPSRDVTKLPDDFPSVVVCNSAPEVGALLSGGVQAWQKYRDQIAGGEWSGQ